MACEEAMRLFVLALLFISGRAQTTPLNGGVSGSGKCALGDVVLVAGQGGTGSEAVALMLEKSGVFQMTGRFGRCE
eukprot:9480158-Pyramimonas_sp.AAC.4